VITMKKLALITTLGLFAATFAVGCDDSTGTGGAGGGTTASTSGSSMNTTTGSSMTTTGSNMSSSSSGMMNPPPPALGAQIDRMGRPAINTATNHTFDTTMATKNAAKDAWNGNGTVSNWVTAFSKDVQSTIAIIDALDTNCGNQLGAGPTATAGRYSLLGDTLAMDRLWVNTAAVSSNVYLGVEANALGVVPNMDGGGRTLSMDVIDSSLSVLVAGLAGNVGDGIAADADTKGTTFPYLAAPH